MALLLCCSFAAATGSPPRSLLPRSAHLEPDEADGLHGPEEAALHAGRHPVKYNRRRTAALTTDNTDPIRISVDYTSLYPETAPPYSACFTEGEWFARGLPSGGIDTPPADGVATCVRGEAEWSSSDCWGKCTADDLITPTGRDIVIGVVDHVVQEVAQYFAVVPVDGWLTFTVSGGRYQKALKAKGYSVNPSCAADCTLLNGVAVAGSYCSAGIAADAVLSITKPPTIQGVGGTGAYCQSDTRGRPTWLVFAWIQSWSTLTGTWQDHLPTYRGLVLHELIHALGFSNSMFNLARDASGKRKGLISLLSVDEGTVDADEVWHFTKGRAYEAAQTYFNCLDPTKWQGLPLMGVPEIGRASHWETRIMRDDVMSYGHTAAVSSITLAAMEDLGFYLGNYSAAQCMSWGQYQGCEYVLSRCASMINDQLASPLSESACNGNPKWASQPISLLTSKCQCGSDPCGSGCSGYSVAGGAAVCNAECFTGPRTDCSQAPTSEVEGASESGFMGIELSENWAQYLWLGAIGLAGFMGVGFVRVLFCPKEGSKMIMAFVATLMVLLGAALTALMAVAIFNVNAVSQVTLVAVEVEAFLGETALYVLLAIGAILLSVGLATLVALCAKSRCLFITLLIFWVLLLLTMFGISAFLAYWIHSLDDVTNDQLATLQGSGSPHEGKVGAAALKEIEGFVCRTYQQCCRDPALDVPVASESSSGVVVYGNRTCLQQHEGTSTDIAVTMQDPSKANFCPYLTGSSDLEVTLPDSVCKLIDLINPVSQCQTNFCLLGAEGYFDFVLNVVAFLREYATWIGAGFSVCVVFQLVLIVNLYNLQKAIKRKHKVGPSGGKVTSKDSGAQMHNPHIPPPVP